MMNPDGIGSSNRFSHVNATRTTVSNRAKSWLDAALGFLYPYNCQICHANRVAPHEGYVCKDCHGAVRFIKAPLCDRCGLPFSGEITSKFECSNCREIELRFSSARAVVAATGNVLDVLHRYKYQRALWFEPFLARLLVRHWIENPKTEKWDLIVPVPLHPLKEREREFNQAERLGRHLSAATQIPMDPNLLTRTVHTKTQTRLTRSQRSANVRRAFRIKGKGHLNGKRVILIDDVLTTGATASACAKTLRSAGAGEVCVWTVARGL